MPKKKIPSSGNMLEREVLSKCKITLDRWVSEGVCIHWDRLQSGSINLKDRFIKMSKKGTPDLVAYIKVNNLCHICWFECKRSSGGDWSHEQRDFNMKFNNLSNVSYHVVTHPDQIDDFIEKLTGHMGNKLKEMGQCLNIV